MISQLTLRIVIGKKEHCIRKCGDKKSRLKQRLWTCETSVNTGDLCSASRFYVFTAMTFSFLKFRFIFIIEKNREQTKKYSGIILGSILPKNEMNYWNIGKRNTEPSVLRKIESNHTNVVTQFFFFFSQFFSQQRTKHWLLFKPRFIFSVSERKWPRVYCKEPCVEITG